MSKYSLIILLAFIISCKNTNNKLTNKINTPPLIALIVDTTIFDKKIIVSTVNNQFSIVEIGYKIDTLDFSLNDLVISSNQNTNYGLFVINNYKFENVNCLISDSLLFISMIDTSYFVNGVLLSFNLRQSGNLILNKENSDFPFILNKYSQFFIDTVHKEIIYAKQNFEESSKVYYFSIYSYETFKFLNYKRDIQFSHPFIQNEDDFKDLVNLFRYSDY